MSNEQNSIPDEQIDLIAIYKKTTSTVKSMINVYIANIKTTIVFILTATLIAISAKYILPKQYTSSFIIRPNDKTKNHIKR